MAESGRKGMGHKAFRQSKHNEEKRQKKTPDLKNQLDEIKEEICNIVDIENFQVARKNMKGSGLAKTDGYLELKNDEN